MSLELKKGESFCEGLQRIARKQIDGSLEWLAGQHQGSRDEAVHEVRKSLKKLRALLRVVRPVVGEEIYRAENVHLRDAGRLLAEIRDANILIETLAALTSECERPTEDLLAGVRGALEADLRAARTRVLEEQNALAGVAAALRESRERIGDWTDVPDRWRSLGKGLTDTYGRAKAAFRQAEGTPTVETFHEWRKQAKYLRYQSEMLLPIWPGRLEEMVAEMHQMTDLLGRDHDLAVLRQKLFDAERSDDQQVLVDCIDQQRAKLASSALMLGTQFFQNAPKQFVRHLKGYWKVWKHPRGIGPSVKHRRDGAEKAVQEGRH